MYVCLREISEFANWRGENYRGPEKCGKEEASEAENKGNKSVVRKVN